MNSNEKLDSVAPELVRRVAEGLGMDVPAAMPKALDTPLVLFDAIVLPDGQAAVDMLSRIGNTNEFIVNTCRHCKTLMVFGALKTPTGEQDTGLIFASAEDAKNATAIFIEAMGMHRHTA